MVMDSERRVPRKRPSPEPDGEVKCVPNFASDPNPWTRHRLRRAARRQAPTETGSRSSRAAVDPGLDPLFLSEIAPYVLALGDDGDVPASPRGLLSESEIRVLGEKALQELADAEWDRARIPTLPPIPEVEDGDLHRCVGWCGASCPIRAHEECRGCTPSSCAIRRDHGPCGNSRVWDLLTRSVPMSVQVRDTGVGVGKGLFASRLLPANSVVGVYLGKGRRDACPPSPYAVEDKRWGVFADAERWGELTRFVNHSHAPNAFADTAHLAIGRRYRLRVLVLRVFDAPIPAGTEITIYYGWTEASPLGRMECKCSDCAQQGVRRRICDKA